MGQKKDFFYKKNNVILEDFNDCIIYTGILTKDPFNLTNKLGKKISFIISVNTIKIKRKNIDILEIELDKLLNWKKKQNRFELFFVNFNYLSTPNISSSDEQLIHDTEINENEYILEFKLFKTNFEKINNDIYTYLGKYMVLRKLITYEEYLFWLKN